jgi:TetR/AcrR family transcriptional regulator, regulator of cefoperazone and chloramphenicol sensitivity
MVPPASHYRPGTHQRGEDTYRRILETAIEVFADQGYEGASTRLLAERAGVNLPAIQYYFGSKEGLYRAAIEDIGQFVESRMAATADRVHAVLAREKLSDQELWALVCDLLDGFLDLITCCDVPPSAGLLIARAEIEDATALHTLQQTVMRLVFQPCMAILARLLKRPAEDEQIKIRVLAIFGQALVFKNHGAKTGACPALGWHNLDATRLEAIRGVLREQTQAILRAAMETAR